MKELNKEWKYKELMLRIKYIRKYYDKMCKEFDNTHDRIIFKRKVKKQVYSYSFGEHRKDIVWLYMCHLTSFKRMREAR